MTKENFSEYFRGLDREKSIAVLLGKIQRAEAFPLRGIPSGNIYRAETPTELQLGVAEDDMFVQWGEESLYNSLSLDPEARECIGLLEEYRFLCKK